MSAIFSVQNLQTFVRRKNLRPPSRGGPPGPERPPPPPPPKRGRSPPPERSPKGREGRSLDGAGAFVSSVITLLINQWLVSSCQYPAKNLSPIPRLLYQVLGTAFTPLPEFLLPPPALQALLPPPPAWAARSPSSWHRAAS